MIENGRLFSVFITKLMELDFLRDPGQRDTNSAPIKRHVYDDNHDLEVATYYFQTLSNVLQYSTPTVMAALASELVVGVDEARCKTLVEREQKFSSNNNSMNLINRIQQTTTEMRT